MCIGKERILEFSHMWASDFLIELSGSPVRIRKRRNYFVPERCEQSVTKYEGFKWNVES